MYARKGRLLQPFLQCGRCALRDRLILVPASRVGHIEGIDRRAFLGADARERDRNAFLA